MKKLLALATASVLALAACGAGETTAATVNGTEISMSGVEGMIYQPGGAIERDQFAGMLDFSIRRVLVAEAASEQFGIEVTDAEIEAEAESVFESFAFEGQSREEWLQSEGVTEEFLTGFVHLNLMDEQVRDHLREEQEQPTDDEIEQGMFEFKMMMSEVCASHILRGLDEEELAQEILDRALAGEDFAELATDYGTDGTAMSGGTLGCRAPWGGQEGYVFEFAQATMEAPVGEVHDQLVESGFGFHIIMVTDREEPDEADLPDEDQVRDALLDGRVDTEFNAWLTSVFVEADVDIPSRFGTWTPGPPNQAQVQPPG